MGIERLVDVADLRQRSIILPTQVVPERCAPVTSSGRRRPLSRSANVVPILSSEQRADGTAGYHGLPQACLPGAEATS